MARRNRGALIGVGFGNYPPPKPFKRPRASMPRSAPTDPPTPSRAFGQADLSSVVEQLGSEFYICDLETGRFLEANRFSRERLGYSLEEMRELMPSDINDELYGRPEAVRERHLGLPETGESVEFETVHRRRDGSTYPVLVNLQRTRYDGREAVVAVGVDSSERCRLRRAAEHKHQMLTLVLNTIPRTSIFWKDTDLLYGGCNEAFAEIAGLGSPEEIVGLSDFDMPWGESEADFYRSCDRRVMDSGNPIVNLEEPITRGDGSVGTLMTSKAPLKNADDETIGVMCLFQDITERKQLEQQLAEARRLESIGQLAAGVSHEINTPLQFIYANIEYLEQTIPVLTAKIDSLTELLASDALPASVEQRRAVFGEAFDRAVSQVELDGVYKQTSEAVEDCSQGVRRVMEIVHAMREFSHPGKSDRSRADINHVIENALTITRHHWGPAATIRRELVDGELPAACYEPEINRLLVNLIVNATDAVREHYPDVDPPEGIITVRSCRAVGGVRIEVEDNGPGVPESLRERIFDPFFTTKEVGEGTGQGLAICQNIVIARHGGELEVTNLPGGGARFSVFLPNEPLVETRRDPIWVAGHSGPSNSSPNATSRTDSSSTLPSSV